MESEIGAAVPLVIPWTAAVAVTGWCAAVAVVAAIAPAVRRR
ncbi:hypothetical protein [Actinoplanes sp. NBRC 101535]|nr:hypothetical protein [Actinoplanes sp. NBRC 101535]